MDFRSPFLGQTAEELLEPPPPPLPFPAAATAAATAPTAAPGFGLLPPQWHDPVLQQLQEQLLFDPSGPLVAAAAQGGPLLLQQQQHHPHYQPQPPPAPPPPPPPPAAPAGGRRRGVGSRGGPITAHAVSRYEKVQRYRERRRMKVDANAQAIEQLAAQAAALERRGADLRAREGAMRATLGAQDALIATMRALKLGGAGAGRRGEVLGAEGPGGGSGGVAVSGDSGLSASRAAAASGASDPAADPGAAASDPASLVPPPPPAQLIDEVSAFTKALESGATQTIRDSGRQPSGVSLASGGGDGGPAAAGASSDVPPPPPARPLPSANSCARGMALHFGRMSRRCARVLLALDSLFEQGEAALSARLGGQDEDGGNGTGATRLAVADALRSRAWPLREDEKARLRRTAAWRAPAALLLGGGGGEQQPMVVEHGADNYGARGGAEGNGADALEEDDNPAAYGLDPLTGQLVSPARLLDALAPLALENEDSREAPLGYRIGFSQGWHLKPEDSAWLRALNLETGEADLRADAHLWIAAAPTLKDALPDELLRREVAALELYERSLAGVHIERRRLERAMLAQGQRGAAPTAVATADADDDELPAQLEALVRREDALTYVYEWSCFAMVDALQRARVMLALWPFWLSCAPVMDAVRLLVRQEDQEKQEQQERQRQADG
jgi:hypothetical protein